MSIDMYENGVVDVDEFSDQEPAPQPSPGQTAMDGRDVPPDEILVQGTVQLGLFDAGGKHPTASSLRLTGGKFGLMDNRAFKKGDTVRFEVTATVDTVTVKDKTDRNAGVVMSCEQQHSAHITDARLLD